jgi:two-component system, chemotaxis family, CheB/CheR fusion protein
LATREARMARQTHSRIVDDDGATIAQLSNTRSRSCGPAAGNNGARDSGKMTGRRRRREKAVAQRPRERAPRAGAIPLAPAVFAVVGLGASAGGLDAFQKFFDALAPGSGMAFILIQHLDPTHQSLMVDLLAGHTPMVVQQAQDGMPLEREHIYIIPPGSYLSISGGTLRLSRPRERHGARMPFDFFLRSLAEEIGERAICVILSGTGADGSLGLKAVKEKGGLVIAQQPDEAGFDGMPRSAIATGAVDLVLPVATIPEVLANYGRQTYFKGDLDSAAPRGQAESGLAEIIDLLRSKTPHDFTLYKPGTLQRRIERRMAMATVIGADRYLGMLRQDARELDLLAKDLLINVTSFFRDPEVFDFLAKEIVPALVRKHTSDRPLRLWVAGCSTGEETYSVAMLFLEEIAAAGRNVKLQVFASDVDGDAVAFARDGLYPETIEVDVSAPRLAHFFTKEDHSYRVVPELREVAVFTVQDVLADPPFSRLDLVCCRNLLIYLRPEAQEKVLLLFHFALREGGILFLGESETVGRLDDRFEPIANAQRIYRHIGRIRAGEVDFPVAGAGARALGLPAAHRRAPQGTRLGEVAQRLLLETYAPASVLINRRNECLYYLGSTDRYLKVVAGEPSRDLLVMAREGLRNKLRAAIRQESEEGARAIVTGAKVEYDGDSFAVSIVVQPVQNEGEELLLVSFLEESKRLQKPRRAIEQIDDPSRVAELERELDAARQELQDTIRELDAANEEHKAIHEEALSVNEEFQSTNEELVTSKEELQSLNEELTALNAQLQETLERQRSTSNDLQNILYSSDVATLFLDGNLNIRFFTPAAKSLFRVIATDIGRPLADLTPLAADVDLLADARAVLANLVPLRREIDTGDGTWYIRRILPYRTHDNRTEGVVITFTDIAEVKAAERKIEAARAYSESIINTIRQPLVVFDDELRVLSGNHAFYRSFALVPEQVVGRQLGQGGVEVPGLRGFLDRVKTEPAPIEDCEIEVELPLLGRRVLLLNAGKIHDGLLEQGKILVAIDDITERKHAADALQAAKRQAEQANLGKSRFLAAASHDLRQPLQTLSLLQGLLAKKIKDPDAAKLVVRLEETLGAMSGMLDTLLDINQLEAGIVRPEAVTFPVKDVLERLRTELAYHAAARSLGWHVVPCGLLVHSDPRLLEQMIRNLLSNAVKYTERGKVLLGCRRRGDTLRIEVWDTGPGIPEGQLKAIFEEFHQLDNSARERNRGLGLGLAIVQRLGDLLGHAVDVRSRPGKGSVFAVEVPLGHEAAGQSPVQRQGELGENTHRGGAILVVEDDPAVREMLQFLLEDEGYDATLAGDGREALDLAARGAPRPDLVVADYNLPNGLNGLQVVAKLQEMHHQEIPVIILTGDISADTLRSIARQGHAQLKKPVKLRELVRLIRQLLSECQPAGQSRARPQSDTGDAQDPVTFVVDDDGAVRDAIRDVLREDGYAVEVYASAEAFLDAYRPRREGCLLVDAVMPGMGGFELLQRLKDRGLRLPAIMITGNGDVHMAVRAMQAGAVDFIEKPIGEGELLLSIERALEQTQDSAKLSAWREAAVARLASLTTRERQIMELVLAGHPSKNIAADLGISQRTVENHRAAIMQKTGSKSLPALVRLALATA